MTKKSSSNKTSSKSKAKTSAKRTNQSKLNQSKPNQSKLSKSSKNAKNNQDVEYISIQRALLASVAIFLFVIFAVITMSLLIAGNITKYSS